MNMNGSTVTKHVEYSDIPEVIKTSAMAGDNETAKYASAPTHIDEKTNKRLFWMINRRILFVMLGTYFCQSLDKGTLNFASIMNIKEDANLKGQEVSIAKIPFITCRGVVSLQFMSWRTVADIWEWPA